MGVQLETIKPGDGENSRVCVAATMLVLTRSSGAFLSFVSSCFQERLSRRRASASWCTTSVSGEAAPAGAPEREYRVFRQRSVTVRHIKGFLRGEIRRLVVVGNRN